MTEKRPAKKRTIADIKWQELDINGQKEQTLNRRDAALYVGKTPTRLDTIFKENFPEITGYHVGLGRTKYFLKSDLDRVKESLSRVHPAQRSKQA